MGLHGGVLVQYCCGQWRAPLRGPASNLSVLVSRCRVLFPCVGLFFLLAGFLFFRPGLFFMFRACRVSPQGRWMAPVSRCRVPVYGCRGPASNRFSVLYCFSRFGRAASRRKSAGWLPFRVAGCLLTAAGLLLPILVCLFLVAL